MPASESTAPDLRTATPVRVVTDEVADVAEARADPQAFEALYRRHYRAIAGYVFRRTGDQDHTDDLVADVFLAAIRALPRFRARGVPLRAWLLRIATNAVNRWARGRRRSRLVPLEPRDPVDERPGPMRDDADAVRHALLALAPRHQAVLALHYFEGLAVDEVARVLGCRPGTIKSRLHRARRHLRQVLGEEESHGSRP